MASWIVRLWRRFRGLFGPDMADLVVAGIQTAAPYVPEVYAIVRRVAQLTPTRTDDEILAAAEALGVRPDMTAPTTGDALARMVLSWAQRKWPEAPVRQLRRAIEIAYGALRP